MQKCWLLLAYAHNFQKKATSPPFLFLSFSGSETNAIIQFEVNGEHGAMFALGCDLNGDGGLAAAPGVLGPAFGVYGRSFRIQVAKLGRLAQHGMAYWLDTGSHRVLFDTGQGMALQTNAAKLGIDLGRADAIVLSHGHYDHVSGLPLALAAAANAALWFHPAAIERKFIRSPQGAARRISTDFMECGDFGNSRIVHRVTAPAEVVPGVWVTGGVPRTNDFEDVGGAFFLDAALEIPDPIADDMALYLPGPDGVSVIFGCAHAGAINTLEHIFQQTGKLPVDALIGGLHLAAASPARMARTVAALHALGPRLMGFGHCTGAHAIHRLWSEFPAACIEIHAGLRLVLPSPV